MPGRKAVPARAIRSIHVPTVKDPDSARAFDIMIAAVQDLQAARNRDVVTFNLVVGTNRIAHGLGRPCLGYTLTKTVTDASFDHAIDTATRAYWEGVVSP